MEWITDPQAWIALARFAGPDRIRIEHGKKQFEIATAQAGTRSIVDQHPVRVPGVAIQRGEAVRD